MAKQTLLQMTQAILNAMSSDEVNSIGDSTESLQVANIIQAKYYDIATRGRLPDDCQLFSLTPSNDETKPTLLTLPAGVTHIEWLKYFDSNPADGQQVSQFGSFSHGVNLDLHPNPNVVTQSPPGYKLVHYMSIPEFLDQINRFNPSDSNVKSYPFTEGGTTFTFLYKNNIQPKYYTVISNLYVIFDSFDNQFDSTLQASKFLCYGQIATPFSLTDSFIPALDDNQFPLLVNEAKALAFYELKQAPHAKAEQEIKRQWSSVQKNKEVSKLSSFDQLPSFGRMPRTGGYGGFAYGPKFWN